VLARLGLGRVADLLGAALGGLDDRLDLLAGLRRERRGRRRRGCRGLAAQLLDLGGDPVQVGVDRGRAVSTRAGSVVGPRICRGSTFMVCSPPEGSWVTRG